MAKGRKTAAMLGLLGAGALAAKQIPYLGRVDLDAGPKATRPELENRIPEYPVPSDDERTAARKRVYETDPAFRNTLRTEDYRPILSGTGLPIRTGGMKKGGVTRADGCITKSHTKGRLV